MPNFVAHSRHGTAVKNVRRHRRYRRALLILQITAVLAVAAAPFLIGWLRLEGGSQLWVLIPMAILVGPALASMPDFFGTPYSFKVYLRPDGDVCRVQRSVYRDLKRVVRKTNTHWNPDVLFDWQKQHDLLADDKRQHDALREKLRADYERRVERERKASAKARFGSK